MSNEIRDFGETAPVPEGDSGGFQGSSGNSVVLPGAVSAGRAISVEVSGLNFYVSLDIAKLVAFAADGAGGQWVAVWDKATDTYRRYSLSDLSGVQEAPTDGGYYVRRNAGWVSQAPPDLSAYVQKTGDTMTGKLSLAASAAGGAGLNLGAGVAPTAPVNGDLWATATAILARLNGASRTVALKEVDNVFTTKQTFVTSTTGAASARIPPGAAPTTPADGDVWQTAAGGLFFRHGANTRTVQFVETLPAFITDAPNDTNAYNRKGGAWVIDAGGGGGIADAPSDGTQYGRLNGAWTATLPLTGGTLTGKLITAASTTAAAGFNITPMVAAPTAPANGDMWLNTGALFVRINGSTLSVATLQQANTYSAKQTMPAAGTTQASITLPHGAAPTSPANGDLWTTTLGMFARISATTYENAWRNKDNAYQIRQTFMASGTGSASINIPPGAVPTGPMDGDFWTTTAGVFFHIPSGNKQVATTDMILPGATVADTAPAVGPAGAMWWDSDSGNTYISNGSAWIMIAQPPVSKSKLYAVACRGVGNESLAVGTYPIWGIFLINSGGWSVDVNGNIIVPVSGTYRITSRVYLNGASNGCRLSLQVNGADAEPFVQFLATESGGMTREASAIKGLNAGDLIRYSVTIGTGPLVVFTGAGHTQVSLELID